MDQFRNKIDQIDEMIMSLLIDRYNSKRYRWIQNENNIPVLDKKRKKKYMKKLRIDIYWKNIEFFKKIYKKMMEETKNVQKNNKV